MKFSKTFLLTLLLVPATSWAMEADGFEPWKEDTMQAESSAATAPLAPKTYQRLQQFAVKELKLKHQLPPVRMGHFEGFPAWHNYAEWYDDQAETGICIGKNFPHFLLPFGAKKGIMLHEADHAKKLHNIIGRLWWAFAPCSLERLADEASIKHSGCHTCVKELARGRRNLPEEIAAKGYLSDTQMLTLAEKTIPADAICPFHKELENRASWCSTAIFPFTLTGYLVALAPKFPFGPTVGLAVLSWIAINMTTYWSAYDQLEQEVADGKLDV